MNDCCYVCSDSRDDMDPFDKYPDMGSCRTVLVEKPVYCDCHVTCDKVMEVRIKRVVVWVCDVCTEEFDSTTEGCA
jgi:hypothetical protein